MRKYPREIGCFPSFLKLPLQNYTSTNKKQSNFIMIIDNFAGIVPPQLRRIK